MKIITEKEIETVIDLYFDKGYYMNDIATKTNISRVTISKIINSYKKQNNIDYKIAMVNFRKDKRGSRSFVNIPPSFFKNIDVTETEKNIQIYVDKKNKEIKIKKMKK